MFQSWKRHISRPKWHQQVHLSIWKLRLYKSASSPVLLSAVICGHLTHIVEFLFVSGYVGRNYLSYSRNVLPRYPCHAWHKAHLLENRTCQEVVRKRGSCLSYQVMTTESGEMRWDFRVFGGKEARLDRQLWLVTEGKESHFIPGFVGGASGRRQLPLSSMGNWLARISRFRAAYLTSVQRLHGGRWYRAQGRRVGDKNVSHPFINGIQNHRVLWGKKSEVKMVIESNNVEESKPWILKMVVARKES